MPASSLSFAEIPSDPWMIEPKLMAPPVGVNAWIPGVAANLMKNVDSSSLNPSVEFHIQNEDFPALPGATAAHRDSNSLPSQPSMSGHGGVSVDGVVSDSRYQDRSLLSQQPKSGIQTHSDGRVTGIPAGMLNDQFGMAGLLTFLRAIENDPAIVALALGHDLTTLGLNLNAPE
uniref:Uncharacterized protein n=1 Tax=Plectus sambesii TaxID=2011161 RepID=A0A914USZ5_9BILA